MSSSSWWVRPVENAAAAGKGAAQLGKPEDLAVEMLRSGQIPHVQDDMAQLTHLHGVVLPVFSASSARNAERHAVVTQCQLTVPGHLPTVA